MENWTFYSKLLETVEEKHGELIYVDWDFNEAVERSGALIKDIYEDLMNSILEAACDNEIERVKVICSPEIYSVFDIEYTSKWHQPREYIEINNISVYKDSNIPTGIVVIERGSETKFFRVKNLVV